VFQKKFLAKNATKNHAPRLHSEQPTANSQQPIANSQNLIATFSLKTSFPLPDVTIKQVSTPRQVEQPLYANSFWQMNQQAFAMQVQGVGSFYACNGNEVEIAPEPTATEASIALYLNGSVYGAILHQRGILPLHGSCFALQGVGVMLCGESGAGKSSLTAAFCLDGAEFLTDDVTPLQLREGVPMILPRSDRIKLWHDSLAQLEKDEHGLTPIWEGETKYYYPMQPSTKAEFPLHQVYVIQIGETDELASAPLSGIEAFTALRNEIYRWEYLPAMPDSEKRYLQQLLELAKTVKVTQVTRPQQIGVFEMKKHLTTLITKELKTNK